MSDVAPTRVLSYLYLGSRKHAKDRSTLLALNIKSVVNCTPTKKLDREKGVPNFFEKETELFTYKRISLFDNIGEDILSVMNEAVSFIEQRKHYGNILVHCHAGVSRSASIVIGYLMRINELTLNEAIEHVVGLRPIVSPNASFLQQLATLESSSIATEETASHVNIGPDCGPHTFRIDVGAVNAPDTEEGEVQQSKRQKRASDCVLSEPQGNDM